MRLHRFIATLCLLSQSALAAETVVDHEKIVSAQLREVIQRNNLVGNGAIPVAKNPSMIQVMPTNDVELRVQSAGNASIEDDEAAVIASRSSQNKQGPQHGLQRKLWFVTAELLGAQLATLAALSALPAESTGWGEGSIPNIFHNAMKGPHFDTDPWYWNFTAHPISGSEYYLLARNRNMKWWQSFIYSAAMSAFWEYVTEGFFERPSIQDLLITPIAGAVLGELRYQAKQALIDPATGKAHGTFKKILVVVLDPIDGLSRL